MPRSKSTGVLSVHKAVRCQNTICSWRQWKEPESLTELNRTIQWDVLDFTRRIHPKQVGVLTLTYHCDQSLSLPFSDRTWYVWRVKTATGVAAGMCATGEKAVESCL